MTATFIISCLAVRLVGLAAQGPQLLPVRPIPQNLPCDLCRDYNWLLVVASGRSGSTAVMDMLNAIPGVLVVGENDGYITKIGAAYRKLNSQPRQWFETPYGAWWRTSTSFDHLLCDIQAMARSLVGTADPKENLSFVGWKEIRYGTVEDLNVITRLFPCAKFVVNYRRDVASQSLSGFYRLRGERTAVVSALLKQNELYMKWAATLGRKRSFTVTLEDFSVQRFNELLTWLGYSNCSYSAVIRSNVNGSKAIPNRSALDAVIPDREYCLPPIVPAF